MRKLSLDIRAGTAATIPADMPVLQNPKREQFCQLIVAGKSQAQAYELAGFTPSRANAGKLRHVEAIERRVAELLEQRNRKDERAMEKAIEASGLTKEWVLTRLIQNAEAALQARDGAVANRALELLGKEQGLFIERRETGPAGAFAALKDEEVHKEIQDELRRAGLSDQGIAAFARVAAKTGSES